MKDGVLRWGIQVRAWDARPRPLRRRTNRRKVKKLSDQAVLHSLSELLALDKELTEVLDYEDVEENDLSVPDPEIAEAVAHIPPGRRLR